MRGIIIAVNIFFYDSENRSTKAKEKEIRGNVIKFLIGETERKKNEENSFRLVSFSANFP
jgi:hypothetical protein